MKISFNLEEHPASSEKTECLLVFHPSLSSFLPRHKPAWARVGGGGGGGGGDDVRKMVLSYGRGWRRRGRRERRVTRLRFLPRRPENQEVELLVLALLGLTGNAVERYSVWMWSGCLLSLTLLP